MKARTFLPMVMLVVFAAQVAVAQFTLPPPPSTTTFGTTTWSSAAAGTYAGLIYDDTDIVHRGFLKLVVSSSGAYSATLVYENGTASYKGSIASNGVTGTDVQVGGAAGNVGLHLQSGARRFQLQGELTLLGRSHSLVLPHMPSVAGPASPLAGSYTVVLLAPTPVINGQPEGHGHATLKISAKSVVTLVGTLADGTKLSFAGPIGSDGRLPLWAPIYNTIPKGHLSGLIHFREVVGVTDLQGQMEWVKPLDMREKYYPGGVRLNPLLLGSRWVAPTAGQLMSPLTLQPPAEPNILLELGIPAELFFRTGSNHKPTIFAKNSSLALKPASGEFSGKDSSGRAFSGVVLQSQDLGAGTLLEPSTSLFCLLKSQAGLSDLLPGNTFAEVRRETAARALATLRNQFPPFGGVLPGLPVNEVNKHGGALKTFFVPAQLGTGLVAWVLGHQVRKADPTFTAGLADAEFAFRVDASLDRLEQIFATPTSLHPHPDYKLLFQTYDSKTATPLRNSTFDKTVSMLDNLFVMLGLKAVQLHVVEAGLDNSLATRAAALLDQMSLLPWLGQSGDLPVLHIGGADKANAGSIVDRILHEGRHAPLLARSMGDIDDLTLQQLVTRMMAATKSGSAGQSLQFLPYSGSSLEAFAVTPYVPIERSRLLGISGFRPLAQAWINVGATLNLPASGATGIADGFGNFKAFTMGPAEKPGPFHNKPVVVFPAVMQMAATAPGIATENNFMNAVAHARARGLFHEFYGLPNAMSITGNDVDNANPVYGTLETAQALVCQLDSILGGNYLGSLLDQDPAWAAASDDYERLCDTFFVQAESGKITSAKVEPRSRGRAFGSASRFFSTAAGTLTLTLPVALAENYEIIIRYSNWGASGEGITLQLDGQTITPPGGIILDDTQPAAPDGDGWNWFEETAAVSIPGQLSAGNHTLVIGSANFNDNGFEVDHIGLRRVP
jgi:hypothetical protein